MQTTLSLDLMAAKWVLTSVSDNNVSDTGTEDETLVNGRKMVFALGAVEGDVIGHQQSHRE
jgi:hypothetical protein